MKILTSTPLAPGDQVASPDAQQTPRGFAGFVNTLPGLGRARGNADDPAPPPRLPRSDMAPRPREGISVLGYRLVGHRPGKPTDKTRDQPPAGCLPGLKNYLPFKLKKLEHAPAPGTPPAPEETRTPEVQEELVEWFDAV